MRRPTFISLFVVLASLGVGIAALSPSQAGQAIHPHATLTFSKWYEDNAGYKQALEEQKQTHKPLFLYIYAPWCPHCKKFSTDVLSKEPLKRFLRHYPHVKVAPDHGLPEQKIMAEYAPEGYPTFYVVYPNHDHVQVDTFITQPKPRPKTALEFLQSLREAVNKK